MSEDSYQKRKAYVAASTYHRAYYERYYPVRVLGGRPAEPVTREALVEIDRLRAVRDAAEAAWKASLRA
jgi:hypothetical protein